MSHRTLAGLIIAVVASAGQSSVQPSALAEAAPTPTVAVEVVVTASTGALNPAGDFCIDAASPVTLTPQVRTLDQNQVTVTEGTIVWQNCVHQGGPLPKTTCDERGGPGRWCDDNEHRYIFDS